jgi:hypothetical protein
MKLFNRSTPPQPQLDPEPPEPPKAIRSAALIREELAMAAESEAPLEARLREAEAELTRAQRRYDAGVQEFALGNGREPDRGEIQVLITRTDALRRVSKSHEKKIATLRSELADAELSEGLAAGRQKLPALTAAAEAKLKIFEQAMNAALEAERDMFRLLFDEDSGLKQRFVSALATEAISARHQLRRRMIAFAEQRGYQLSVRWETDGDANLGATLDYLTTKRRAVEIAV